MRVRLDLIHQKILLTHEHADAVLGLNDMLVVQPFSPTNDIDPTPVYLTLHSMDRLSKLIKEVISKANPIDWNESQV
ncbi:hypothetical protein JHK87_012868 [Glycine soja]|nr:hypothetical protein JHK87_012868 [Glycine soja]